MTHPFTPDPADPRGPLEPRDTQPAPKPQADVFAKVDDGRLDEYRLAESLDLLPFYHEIDGEIGPTVTFRGRPVVMLGSNNYLGLTTDSRVRAAAAAALARYGTGITGSRLLNGTLRLHRELEDLLADWVGLESALVFTTGYAANLGLLGALVGRDDVAVVDSAAHASLVDGARFSEGTLRAFRHNRANSLRRTLRSWREQPDAGGALVAVDGIYSMEGDWAPLGDIAALCHDFGARLLVDEAHALGVVGPRGAGHLGRHGGSARPDHGHVLQVACQLWRVRRRTAVGDRLPQGHLPALDVHGVGGPGRPGGGPGSGPDRPGRGVAPGGGQRPGRAAASRAGPAGPGGRRPRCAARS